MAEFRSGLLLNVGFETLPVVLGGVYFVIIGTNRNQLFELMNLSRKPKNSIRDAQSHPNSDGVKRLRKEIVNASFSAEVVVFRAGSRRSEGENRYTVCSGAPALADKTPSHLSPASSNLLHHH